MSGNVKQFEEDRFQFSHADRAHINQYISDMEQLAYARSSTLDQGNGRGNRIIEVNNGSGLCFTVSPDRGLDIVEASFRGLPLAFRTPCGHMNRSMCQNRGFQWLRSWAGGLLTTCGLRHVGPPTVNQDSPLDPEYGLHGQISYQAAEDVSINREWNQGKYQIEISGRMRESMMFGENLCLQRSIITRLGDNCIHIKDTVTNEGHRTEPLKILYHCNFGYPAIQPGTRISPDSHKAIPRDAASEQEINQWYVMQESQKSITEQCFLHDLSADRTGWSSIQAKNESAHLCITVSFHKQNLPYLLQWKLPENGRFALGLEPTNTNFNTNDICEILPQQKIEFQLMLRFETF